MSPSGPCSEISLLDFFAAGLGGVGRIVSGCAPATLDSVLILIGKG
jgi:hypothetical protein